MHWPNSLKLIEGFCTVCEQPWVDLNPRLFGQKATTLVLLLTAAPPRPSNQYQRVRVVIRSSTMAKIDAKVTCQQPQARR